MEYLALDIETTGLNIDQVQILQIAAVYVKDDVRTEFSILIDNGPITHGEPSALVMNSWIFAEILKKRKGQSTKYPVLSLSEAKAEFQKFVLGFPYRSTPAGKNISSFDIPILRNNGFCTMFSHRAIDVGSLYLPDFGYVPSLSEINLKLGRPTVSHDALEDCRDVVAAIDAKTISRSGIDGIVPPQTNLK